MAVQADFALARGEDGTLVISMQPATDVSGWPIRFQVAKRFGSDAPFVTKSVASGFNGASGILVTNGPQGVFNVDIKSIDTSGLQFGNWAYTAQRDSSGSRTVLSEGFMLLLPSIGG